MKMSIRIGAASALWLLGSCADGLRMAPAPKERPVSLLLLGDLKGTIEPCGCTSHPLGGIYRLSSVARAARTDSVAVAMLAAGDLFYESEQPHRASGPQDEARAEILADALRRIGLWVSAVGELDRPAAPRFAELTRRSAATWLGAPAHPRVAKRDAAGLTIAAIAARPGDRLGAEVQAARRDGAHVVVLLAHGDGRDARAIARAAPEADFVLAGHATHARERPELVGPVAVLEPGPLGQHIGRLDLYAPRPGERFADGDPGREGVLVAGLRVAQARRRLLEGRKHGLPPAALSFYETTLARAQAEERRARAAAAARRPLGRNHFRWRLVPLDRSVPDDPDLVALRDRYKLRLRALNLRHAAEIKAPPAGAGAAAYRGNQSCGTCHFEAQDFWKKTKHARAWATLVRDKSDYDLACVGCHMTGYLRPGGSSLAERAELRDVGCESCHGPGSLHEDAPDDKKKALITRAPDEATCTGCHNPEHSDLFSFPTYRARVIGPGHGAPLAPSGGAKR